MDKKKKGTIRALLIAFVMAVVVFIVIITVERMILTNYRKVSVVTARTDIPAGTLITDDNKSKYFGITEVPEDTLLNNSITSLEDIEEYQVAYDMQEREQLTKNKMKNITSEIMEDYENPVEASLRVDNISEAVSGTLRRGDRVDILGYVASDGFGKEMKVLLENVFISGTYDTGGNEITAAGMGGASVVFNFIIEKKDYTVFAEAAEKGGIQLIKVSDIK